MKEVILMLYLRMNTDQEEEHISELEHLRVKRIDGEYEEEEEDDGSHYYGWFRRPGRCRLFQPQSGFKLGAFRMMPLPVPDDV